MTFNSIIKKIPVYLCVLLASVIQVGFSQKFSLFGMLPNIILIFGLSYLLLSDYEQSSIWLVFGGIVLDLLSPARFGWITISFLIILLPFYYILRRIIRNSSLSVVLISFFAASLVSETFLIVVLKTSFSWSIIYYGFVNSLLGLVIYNIINSRKRQLEPIKL